MSVKKQVGTKASFQNGLYVEDTLGINSSFDDKLIERIASSQYNFVVLAFLHTRPQSPNDLYYNDTQIYRDVGGNMEPVDPQFNQILLERVSQIRSVPSTPKVMFSLGPQQSDYDNIASSVPKFASNFRFMCQGDVLNVDGIDLDYEGEHGASYQQLVAELAKQCAEPNPDQYTPFVTAAPYFDPDWWANLLKKSIISTGENAFSWFNVQLYAGGNPQVNQGAQDFAIWEKAIAKVNSGIPNVSNFIAPGICPSPKWPNPYTPFMFTQLVSNIHNTYPDIGGAFAWKYGYVASDITAWSEAPLNGLGLTAAAKVRKTG